MPMLNCINNLIRDRQGSSVIEFALVLPMMMLLFAGMTELGRAYFQANAVEKGVRAGAYFISRQPLPITAAARASAENLIRTGTLDGSGQPLVSGWGNGGSSVNITTSDYIDGTLSVPVIRVEVEVPFDPMVPHLTSFVGVSPFFIRTEHEQAYIGD